MQVERFKILNVGWVGPSNFVYVYTSWRWRGVESKAPCRLPFTSSNSQKSCTDFMVFLQNVATPEHDIPKRGISPAFCYFDVFVSFQILRLGSVSGALGLSKFLEGHNFVVTSSKDGPDSVFEKELPDADVVPWWAEMTGTCWSEECCNDRTIIGCWKDRCCKLKCVDSKPYGGKLCIAPKSMMLTLYLFWTFG